MNRYKVGEVVKLKGNSNMTVTKIVDNKLYQCDWFEGNTRFRKVFKEEQLENI